MDYDELEKELISLVVHRDFEGIFLFKLKYPLHNDRPRKEQIRYDDAMRAALNVAIRRGDKRIFREITFYGSESGYKVCTYDQVLIAFERDDPEILQLIWECVYSENRYRYIRSLSEVCEVFERNIINRRWRMIRAYHEISHFPEVLIGILWTLPSKRSWREDVQFVKEKTGVCLTGTPGSDRLPPGFP